MNINPLRRSPLKKKAKQHKESAPWRREKIRLDGKEMGALRGYAWDRSNGQCENAPFDHLPGERCRTRVTWWTGELAHLEDRGRGGSDVKENVLFTCRECHYEHTRSRRRLVPHKDWQP